MPFIPQTVKTGCNRFLRKLALLALVAEQEFPGRPYEVEITYPLLGLEKKSQATLAIIKNRRDKMDKIANQIELGVFQENSGMFNCRSCAFQLVCGGASDESES